MLANVDHSAEPDVRPADAASDDAAAERRGRLAEPLLVAVFALALLIVGYNRSLLPSYYFNDDRTLRTNMAGHPHISRSNSFSTAAFIFDSVGLRDASTAVGFITFGLFVIGVVLARRATSVRALTLTDAAVYGFALLMGAVYLGQLSKEPFVLVVVIGFLLLARRPGAELAWGLVLVLPLALYLRPYWALVGLFYLAFRLWFRRDRGARHLAILPVVALLVLSLAVHLVLGKASVVSFRTDVQKDLTTLYGVANTSVHDYLPTTGLGFGWADAVLSLFLLIVPIPLLLLGGAQYLLTGLVISGLWFRFFNVVRSYSGRFSTMPILVRNCVFLTLSFVSIQAIFEPDYGSFLRHLTDLMPVFLVVVGAGRNQQPRTPTPALPAPAEALPVESAPAARRQPNRPRGAALPGAELPRRRPRPRPGPGPSRRPLPRPGPTPDGTRTPVPSLFGPPYVRTGIDAKPTPSTRDKRLDIQGLRMVAVVAVFVNHLSGHPRGAFTGVDVFFVLSGYLITGLLVRDAGRVGVARFFAGFYERRARRILPAALTVLAVSWVAAGLTFAGARVRDAHTDIGWSLGFLANVHSARLGTDYFAQGRAPSITQHFWSLAVEEQFYVVWPVVVLVVVAVVGRRGHRSLGALLGVSTVLTVASFVYALKDTTDSPTTAYFSTFARAWELGVGAVLAVLLTLFPGLPARLGRARGPLALGAVLAIVASFFVVSPTDGFPAPWAAFPVLATALVLVASAADGAWTWVLTNRASVYVGEISYSLYLWHWPTIVVISALLPHRTPLYYTVVVASAVALSVFSFEFIETPLRTRRQNRLEGEPRPRKATALVAAGLAVVAFASYTLKPEPTQPHFVANETSTQVARDPNVYRPSAAVQTGLTTALAATRFPTLYPSLQHLGLSAAFKDWQGCLSTDTVLPTCVFRPAKPNGKRALVYGDSIGLSYLPGIRRALLAQGWTVYGYARTQCAAADVKPARQGETARSLAGCVQHHAALASVADRVKPQLIVMTSTETTIATLASKATGAAALDEYRTGLRASVAAVQQTGRQIVILSPPPIGKSLLSCDTAGAGPADCVGSISDNWLDQSGADSDVAHQTGARYVDTRLLTCSTAAYCPSFVGSTPIMYDGGHMTRQYSIQISADLGAALLGQPAPGK